MKKIYLIVAGFLIGNSFLAQTADLESVLTIPTEAFWDGSDMSGTSNGSGLFDTTFVDNEIEFANQYDTTWGATYGYWSQGWAFSDVTSDTLTGFNGLYSSYAGGANSGNNYAVGTNLSELTVTGNGVTVLSTIYITNNNYAAHSMLTGDSFAKKFGSPNNAGGNPDGTNGEDWFLLTIVGYNLQGDVTDSVGFYLADYRFADSTQDYIVKNWTAVDLSSLGGVHKIQFKLSSSDNGQFGMNTPAFFAVDDVSHGTVGIDEQSEVEFSCFPNPVSEVLTINTDVPGGRIALFDLTGKQLLSKQIINTTMTVDLSSFPHGVYNLVVSSENSRFSKKIVKL